MPDVVEKEILFYDVMDSPVGKLRLVCSNKALRAVLFESSRTTGLARDSALEKNEKHPILMAAKKQLGEYFAGKRQMFDLPLDAKGSVFQMKAWKELSKIPYGQTISYGEQALRIGDVKKARAAGMANGRNPLSIIVPCHRVIGASGELTGFGGGLKVKKFLLDMEKKHAVSESNKPYRQAAAS